MTNDQILKTVKNTYIDLTRLRTGEIQKFLLIIADAGVQFEEQKLSEFISLKDISESYKEYNYLFVYEKNGKMFVEASNENYADKFNLTRISDKSFLTLLEYVVNTKSVVDAPIFESARKELEGFEFVESEYKPNPEIEIKFLDKNCSIPKYGTSGSAAVDLRANIPNEGVTEGSITIKAGESVMIGTGLAINIKNPNLCATILPRSGLGSKHGIVLGNLVGLIDSDYQGELMISCWNRSSVDYVVYNKDRIAQLAFVPVVQAQFEVVDEFSLTTERGEGGFGHTGVS